MQEILDVVGPSHLEAQVRSSSCLDTQFMLLQVSGHEAHQNLSVDPVLVLDQWLYLYFQQEVIDSGSTALDLGQQDRSDT